MTGDYLPPSVEWLDSRLSIAENFRPKSLSLVEISARSSLLGYSPDYHYLSYRLSQIYALVFCGKYDDNLAGFDPRLTIPAQWRYPFPPYRTSPIGEELGRFNGKTSVNDITGESLFSVRLQLDATSYRVSESSRPLSAVATLFGVRLAGETWWVDKVPGVSAAAELAVSQINKPAKSLYSVYLDFQALSHDFENLLSQLSANRREQLVVLLADSRPWYDRLAGWLILLAEVAKQ